MKKKANITKDEDKQLFEEGHALALRAMRIDPMKGTDLLKEFSKESLEQILDLLNHGKQQNMEKIKMIGEMSAAYRKLTNLIEKATLAQSYISEFVQEVFLTDFAKDNGQFDKELLKQEVRLAIAKKENDVPMT